MFGPSVVGYTAQGHISDTYHTCSATLNVSVALNRLETSLTSRIGVIRGTLLRIEIQENTGFDCNRAFDR